MFCPKCGQQQISETTRFCSRCGLAIGGLAEWLEGGGALSLRDEAAPLVSHSPRRKGISRGAKLMFLSGVLMPIFFGMGILVDGPAPLIVPITIFLAGLSMMLYARLFAEETAPVRSLKTGPTGLRAVSEQNALPSASPAVANILGGQTVRAAELAEPPSVTEHTTRLLKNE